MNLCSYLHTQIYHASFKSINRTVLLETPFVDIINKQKCNFSFSFHLQMLENRGIEPVLSGVSTREGG
jgi:hypothetical protein